MAIDFVPGGTVVVPDVPFQEDVELPAERTALIVVDMQNDLVDPEGALCGLVAKEALPQVGDVARRRGAHVTCTQYTHVECDQAV